MPDLPGFIARPLTWMRHNLRWSVAILLGLATVINYLDRSSLSVVSLPLKEDFGIDDGHIAYIAAGFEVTYMLMQPVAGLFIDWVGARVGFIVSVIWWSIASMLHGLGIGWRSMTACRALLGVGEAGNFPGAAKTVNEWFPPRERTIATGIYNSGASIGGVIAPPIVAAIILIWNWRVAFFLTGAVGFLWVILWAILYRPLARHPWISERERRHIEAGGEELAAQETEEPAALPGASRDPAWRIVLSRWWSVVTQRNFWGIALARFLSEPAWRLILYFIPLYMERAHGWKLKETMYYVWLPFVGADLGCLFGGFLPPLFQKLGLSILTARKASATVAGLIMLTAALIAGATSPFWAIFYIAVAAFAHQTMSSTLLTLPADLFPKRTVATAFGLAGTVGYAGGLIFLGIISQVVDTYGYSPLFTTIAFLDIIGAGLVWLLIRKPKIAPPAPAAA
jgi:MFS transporter, ACS family, hexuronate transporter